MLMIVLLSFILGSVARGQGTGVLRGTVEDASGEYVVGAEVKLHNQTTGQEFSTSSDEGGQFQFSSLALGDYLLLVDAQGFKPAEVSIKVGAGQDNPVRVPLRIAPVAESVTVHANAASTPTAEQNMDVVEIDRHWLENLPLKEGDPLAVPSLFLDPATAGVLGPKLIVDGVETSALEVPLTSIRKVYVNSSPYSAEFGRPGRGRIEVVTRKGSRHFYHGNVTFLFRDSAFDARNAFARVPPPLQRETAEAEFDGPLGKKVRFLLASRYYIDDESATVDAHTLAGSLVENFGIPERSTRLFGRLDFELTPAQTLTLSYKYKNNSRRNQGVGGFNLPERAMDFNDHENEFKVFERAIISASFLNEIRFAFKDEPQQTVSRLDQPAMIVLGAFSSGGAQVARHQRERAVTIQDVATLVQGRHTISFGAGARPRIFRTADTSNFGGTFTFPSLAAFSAGQPELFTINPGNRRVALAQQQEYYSFLQDEIQLGPRFSLSLGLRYEWQSNLTDYNNLAPRLAFAYSPGGGQSVLRGGFGVFYDRQPEIMQQQALLYGRPQDGQIVVRNPGFPVPFDPAVPPPPSVVRIDPNIRTPYLMQASIGVERRLGKGRNFLAVDYTIVHGMKLYRTRNINAPLPATAVRPDSNFVNINQFESSGRSRSHSLTVSFQTPLGRRLDLLGQYTLSRAKDDTSGLFSLPANNYDLRGEYGRADYDRRYRFNLVGVYRLPWGFKAGMIASLNSGIPFNISTGFDNNGDTVPNDRPAGVGRNTGKGPGYASFDVHFSKEFTFGKNEGGAKPAIKGPLSGMGGDVDGDLLVWTATVTAKGRSERHGPRLEIGMDAFNVFNRVNPNDYVGTQTSPFFGRANAANPARQLQVSLKLHF